MMIIVIIIIIIIITINNYNYFKIGIHILKKPLNKSVPMIF